MPSRRPSASTGPHPTPSSSNAPRAHKSNDSHHILMGMSSIQQHSLSSLGASATPQQKIIQVLVNRLKNKLPCNSGLSLDRLEGDTAIQQTIEALVELSNDSLDIIAWALSELLDRLAKQTDNTGLLTIEVLQSQLFILKVLSMTMASRWNTSPRSSSRTSNNHPVTSPDSPQMTGSARLNRQASSDYSIPPPGSQEPLPLDDNCARYVLSVMVLFLRQTASPDQPLMHPNPFSDLTFRDFESHHLVLGSADSSQDLPPTPISGYTRTQESILRGQSSSNSVKSGKASLSSTIQIPSTRTIFEKTHVSLVKSSLPVSTLIAKYAGRIVFHISASNWQVVYSRLRTKIHFLASNTSDNPDLTDLQLMACSALDKQRLVQLLIELSSLLVNMEREYQLAIAVPLRSAVWNWIVTFPSEFNDAIRYRGKTDGAPERVFDLLYSRIAGNDEKIFWPTLAILECTTSDRLSSDFQFSYAGSTKSSRKELKFGEDILKHALSNSKLSEVALVCLLDICRAATHVRPDNDVPLKMIASDIAHEIKAALSFSPPRKPFWEASEVIDIAIYAEALVTMYRFLPEEDALPFFTICAEPERSEAVKTCVVRACLTLAQEAGRIKSQNPLDKLEDVLAVRFRNIFRTAGLRQPELDQYGNMKRIASRPKSIRISGQPLSDREVLLLGILSLWRANPFFFLKNITPLEMEEWVITGNRIWEAPMDISVKVSNASCFYTYAAALFSTPPSDTADPILELKVSFLKLALPSVLLSIVTNLLHSRSDVETERLWVAIAHQLIELYVRKTDSQLIKDVQHDARRVPAFALAEIAFLVSLTSADSNVSHLAAKGLRLLSYAEREPGVPTNQTVTDENRSKRNPIYEQLGDPKVVIVGRVGHQKRIRKLVRLISYPSAAHVAVWQECYWRWRALSEVIFEAMSEAAEHGDTTPHPPAWQQEQRFQWQNLTLFLAALGGACVQEHQDLTSLSAVIPLHSLPDEIRVMQNPSALVGTFITDLTNLLVVHDTQIRDVARDALGAELSPRLYAKLLKHLDETIRGIEEGAGSELTDAYLLFLDQFIAVLKLLVEGTHAEDVMSIDITSTMLTLANFMARFTGPTTCRVKTKFCIMCESVCDRTDTLTVRKDNSARHSILDIVMSWIQSEDIDGELATVQSELNMACLRTSVKLLDRLQLRPVDNSNTGDDTVHVISRLFNKYSGALLQALEACQIDSSISDSVSDVSSMHQKMRISQREAEIRELVITGLSHLVSANTESGFKQCLSLAYDQDNRKRAIFAHVFARVIGQGTKFDPEDRSATLARHTRLCELVKGSDMVLALTICEICPPSEVEMMISVLLNIFNTRTSLLNLIKIMIEKEVAATENEANLFRSNSTCTRFLSAFAKIHGYNYLRTLVLPLIKTMADKPPGHGYDLDPSKASGEEVKKNQRNVEIVASSFLEIVSSSVPAIPPMFREICAHIAKTVVEVWPDAKFAATGAFIFLRFISPAVVAPETIDIELPKDSNIVLRRGLMVVAKIIQNLANNIFFGKEAHMVVLNTFLKENITNVTRFLSEISKYSPSTVEEETDQWLGTTSDDTDIIVLHRFFDKHADKIGKELLSLSKPSTNGDSSAISGKRAWDGLCALLVDLGPPLEVPRPSPLPSAIHREYNDLMARCSDRRTKEVEDIFLETDGPATKSAVFILRLSKVDVEALDIELVMFYIFKTLEQPAYQDRMFDLILDCTAFTSISEVPLQWLKYCAELIPSDIRSRFHTTHILNPNALTQKYMRRLYNVTAGTPICDSVRAYSSVADLMEHVPMEAMNGLTYPLALEEESTETFTEATMKCPQPRPIVLQVGTTHLRITSVKTQPISPGFSCKGTEIIPLVDISDVYNVSTGTDLYEFIIRRNRHGMTVYFSSAQRETIVKTIRSAKGRLKESPPPLTERFSRFLNVPATLLHVGLLCVDLDDEELRGAAYDLLGAVCTYLKYDKSPIVASQAGFIPGDPSAFVTQLSEKIAGFAPQLTLDFIMEVVSGMEKTSKTAQRISCIHYISPWMKNLALFSNPTSSLYERSGARLRDCIRKLTEVSSTYPEITSTIQRYIWAEVGKLDPVIIDVILDEIVRKATDGGMGTRQCEAIAHAIASMSSIGVRGRIYSKLRRVLGRVYLSALSNHRLTDHPNWNEIQVLIRFSLVVGPSSGQAGCDLLYVPEIIHIVTLAAGFGPPLIRKSVYGIVMNLLQALYISRTADAMGPELLQLITDCTSAEKLQLFGLRRDTPTSDYMNVDPASDKECLDTQEHLTQFLLKVMEVSSGSIGLLNVWRARWMSLVTASAFQVSPAVQTRAFIALGTLATSDVEDDFLYQILVAFNTALTRATETHTLSVVSMLRCMCKIAPALPKNSRYICLLFWLAVALLQASHFAFYIEATCLLRVTLENMETRGMIQSGSVSSFLLKSRTSLEEITSQLDDILKISFESSFSFSLASIIFKGIRHTGLRDAAEAVLRSLLCVTVRSQANNDIPSGFRDSINPDALGYFLALLPLSTTPTAYRRLLDDCNIDDAWLPDAGLDAFDDDNCSAPRISPAFLGVTDSSTALLVASFVGTMLTTAQGDDKETEILLTLLSDIANTFPQIVALTYEGLQDRIKDAFANSSNPAIIRAVSNIFRISLQDPSRQTTLRGSASTLNTVDESTHGPSKAHLNALDELGMQGLASNFQFLPANRGHATKMIHWIPGLVSLIIA
ncbi:Neurofibromin [Hypsizygus marmoreus]|uniref:Neurofibromin n=1 Tax=Hypsizygus marmoreus TaxID=39966 RepID=A0A369JHN1_HYPMA|nr:Neurofibromin [Hypsizygus marmoreus]